MFDIPKVIFIDILDTDKKASSCTQKPYQDQRLSSPKYQLKIVFYADNITDSIKKAVSETERRRNMQIAFNKEHGIVPQTIRKPIREKVVDITDVKNIPKIELLMLLLNWMPR